MSNDNVHIEIEQISDTKFNVSLRRCEELLIQDSFNVHNAQRRKRFANDIVEKFPAFDVDEIEPLFLLEIERLKRPTSTSGPHIEIPDDCIVRPERIIRPDFSAISIPVRRLRDENVEAQWSMYVTDDSGRRVIPINRSIKVGDNTLYVAPIPGEPGIHASSGWSEKSRTLWLAGNDAPDPARVLENVCERINSFVEFPLDQAKAITTTLACWVIMTYGYHAFRAVPYIYLGGPASSGKTTTFDVLRRMVFRCFSTQNVTAAGIFRTLNDAGGTLLYDEAEGLRHDSPEAQAILSMLLAGYKRGGTASRLEPFGDSFRMVSFDVYGPKALACINGLTPALSSRCIEITMFRASRESEKPKRRIDAQPEIWQSVRDDLHCLALGMGGTTWHSIANDTEVDISFGGRDSELWQPILSIANWIESSGGLDGVVELIRKYALNVIESRHESGIPHRDATILLAVVGELKRGNSPRPSDVHNIVKREDRFFESWSPRAISNCLKRYGIETVKRSGNRVYGYSLMDHLIQVQNRYGVDLDLTSDTP